MAEEEAAWKAQVRQRVVSAHDRLHLGRESLLLAKDSYEWPISPQIAFQGLGAWAAAHRVKYSVAMEALGAATRHLNSSVADMTVAEMLTLLGGNRADPSTRLASLQDLDPQDAAVRAALERIHESRPVLKLAVEFTEWCRGHLSMAIAFLSSPAGIPNAIALADREGFDAYDALRYAMRETQVVWDDVTAARQILDPAAP